MHRGLWRRVNKADPVVVEPVVVEPVVVEPEPQPEPEPLPPPPPPPKPLIDISKRWAKRAQQLVSAGYTVDQKGYHIQEKYGGLRLIMTLTKDGTNRYLFYNNKVFRGESTTRQWPRM
jgi:hypothetical protein